MLVNLTGKAGETMMHNINTKDKTTLDKIAKIGKYIKTIQVCKVILKLIDLFS